MDRRKFIALSSIFASYPAFSKVRLDNKVIADTLGINTSNLTPSPGNSEIITPDAVPEKIFKPIIPPGLKPGSKIAITSPSSTTNIWELTKTIKVLKGMGLEVILGKTVTEQSNNNRYLSAPDPFRAEEFNSFAGREDIAAVLASRGGYGSMRMINLIDFESIKKYPKIFIGFSDFTFVLLAISKICNLVTYHGPVGISTFSPFTKDFFVKALFQSKSNTLQIKYDQIQIVNPGIAEGRLIGGNLTMLASTLGTKYEFDSNNSILFFEEVNEHAYQIDRLLNQLKLAGKFDTVRALIIGKFNNLNTRRPFYPNFGYSIMEVINQILKPLKIPTILNFPVGHISEQVTLPLLLNSTIDTNKKSLVININ